MLLIFAREGQYRTSSIDKEAVKAAFDQRTTLHFVDDTGEDRAVPVTELLGAQILPETCEESDGS